MTRERSGRVRVRENHVGTLLPTDAIDGEVVVDLDADTPHVVLPPGFGAIVDDEQAGEERTAADGGQPVTAEREVETHGAGLSEELATWTTAGGGALLAVGGWLLSHPGAVGAAGGLAIAVGALALYIGGQSYWGESV